MARARIDPEAVLCEGCGYEIGGLIEADASGACPECGRALAASMPGRRPGSAWQARPGMLALLATWWRVLRHPRGVWDEVRPAEPGVLAKRARWLRVCTNAAAVFAVLGLGLLVTFWDSMGGLSVGALRWLLPLSGGVFLLLEVLCRIESIGIRLIGQQRGWRVTPGIARAVIAHASVGWVLAGVLVAGGIGLGRWSLGFIRDGGRPRPGDWLTPLLEAAPVLLPAGGFLAGMLAFEALVYVGVRRMRFVNREAGSGEPGSEARP